MDWNNPVSVDTKNGEMSDSTCSLRWNMYLTWWDWRWGNEARWGLSISTWYDVQLWQNSSDVRIVVIMGLGYWLESTGKSWVSMCSVSWSGCWDTGCSSLHKLCPYNVCSLMNACCVKSLHRQTGTQMTWALPSWKMSCDSNRNSGKQNLSNDKVTVTSNSNKKLLKVKMRDVVPLGGEVKITWT